MISCWKDWLELNFVSKSKKGVSALSLGPWTYLLAQLFLLVRPYGPDLVGALQTVETLCS